MKKYFPQIIVSVLILVASLSWAVSFAQRLEVEHQLKVEQQRVADLKQEQENLLNYSYTFEVVGDSVCTFGYCNGDMAKVYPGRSCNVGDVCSFLCIADRCKDYQNTYMIKEVEKIDGDKYWIVGRPGVYWDSHLKISGISFDSPNYFGWLTKGQDVLVEGPISK